MTTIKDMTPAELRIAIAEQLGMETEMRWVLDGYDATEENIYPGQAQRLCFWPEDTLQDKWFVVPDWPNDIAEAYALEGQFTDYTSRRRYWSHLSDVVDPRNLTDDSTFGWAMIHATAEQRCRAWMLVKHEG